MAVYKSKKPTKDGRQYFFRIKYKDIFGEHHDYTSMKFKTLKEATSEEARYKIKTINQEVCVSKITIEQAYLELINEKSKNLKKQSIVKDNNLYKHLLPIKDKKINDLNLAIYKQFQINLENQDLSTIYRNKILGLLKQILNYSNKYYNTSLNIIKYIEPYKEVNKIKKEMDFFTYNEYLQFDKVIDDLDWHTFFEVLYFLGLRQGEVQALTWEDIDFKQETIRINKTLTTKIKGEQWTISSPKTKNSIRVIPLTEKLIKDLKALKSNAQQYVDYSDKWFVFGNTRPLPENTIQIRKNKYCRLAGVKQIRIHDFRHSCASLLINKGASITLVAKYLGHSKASVTLNIYAHMYTSELEKMTNILNNL